MKDKISDLRHHLFATLEALTDPETKVDLARVKAITEVSQTLINSAKVEVDFLKATEGRKGTGFFQRVAPISEDEESLNACDREIAARMRLVKD